MYDGVYVGLEDIRLFSHKNQLYFNANRGYNNRFYIEHGTILKNDTENIIEYPNTGSEKEKIKKRYFWDLLK